jgi:hypothetical protein
MSIEVVNKNITNRFSIGDIVFRITARDVVSDLPVNHERNVNIVTSFEDYKKKLHSHLYTPLLFTCDLPMRLAYLHGCLNYNFNQPHAEVYTFWWRAIGTDKWDVWFRVKPYNDIDPVVST